MKDVVTEAKAMLAEADPAWHFRPTLEALLSIVERLPVTADGVRVVPGMELWDCTEDGETGLCWADMGESDEPRASTPEAIEAGYGVWDGGRWYSTRDAAEAAGGEA